MARTRFPRTVLVSLCDECPAPIYAIDAEGKIVYANPALQAWLEVPVDEFLGAVSRWQHATAAAEQPLPAFLCPPPDVAARGPIRWHLRIPREGALPLESSAWAIPIGGPDDEAPASLVLVTPFDLSVWPATDDRPAPEIWHQELLELTHRFRKKFTVERLVGVSPSQQRIRQQVLMASTSRFPVSIVGPVGSGTDVIGRTIVSMQQGASPAPWGGPLSCPYLDAETLTANLDSLLLQANELARFGCLLLLDVDQLAVDAQRVLAHWMVDRGMDCQFISVSQGDLMALAAEGRFHAPLACALTTLTIHVPALSERMEDLPYWVQQITESLNAETGRSLVGVSPDALELLQSHTWPGNYDELSKCIREAYVACKDPVIRVADLPRAFRDAMATAAPLLPAPEPIDLEQLLRHIEVRYLRRAVELAGGNKTMAARLLCISRNKFLRRWEQLLDGVAASDDDEETAEGD